MALSFIGLSSAVASSVALPAFEPGDLALCYAYRDGSNTPPTLPSGWTNIASSGANSNSSRLGRRILQSGDTTTGTWTNATDIEVLILRGQDADNPVGLNAGTGGANNSNQISYSPVDMEVDDGTSWIAAFAGHRTATDVNTKAVTGMTTRSGSTTSLGAHTAEGVASFTTSPYTATVNASSGWRSYAVEVRAAPAATETAVAEVSLDVGEVPASRTDHAVFVRGRKTNAAHSGTLRLTLYEGATARSDELETPELTTSLQDYELAIDDADAATVGSYANLSLRIYGVSAGSDATVFEVAHAYLVIPQPTTGEVFGAVSIAETTTVVATGSVEGAGATQTAIASISLAGGAIPETRTDHDIVLRARKTNAAHTAALEVQLFEGATPRSAILTTGNLTDALAEYALAIDDADAATITSYADLAVRLQGVSSTGDAAVLEVAQVELRLPVAFAGEDITGQVVFASIATVSVGELVTPVYPGTAVFPQNLVSIGATSTITLLAGGADITGAVTIDSTASVIAGGATPPTNITGLVSITDTASVTVGGEFEHTGAVSIGETVFIAVGSFAFQDVSGAVSISATTSVSASGDVPAAALPPNFIDLPFDLPDILVAIALASAPLDADQTYTGVGPFTRGIGARRGRQFELDRVEAGELDFLLDNRDGRFNPENTASPYFPDLKPTRRVRWAMRWPTDENGIVYEVFTGYLEGYPQEYPSLGFDSIVRQRAIDAFMALRLARLRPGTTTLAQAIVTGGPSPPPPEEGSPPGPFTETILVDNTGLPMPQVAPFEITIHDETMTVDAILGVNSYQVTRSGETSFHALGSTVSTENVSFGEALTGARILQLLDSAGYTTDLDIDGGNSLLAATGDIRGDDPLSHILEAVEAENGRFFAAKDGRLSFRERHWFFKNELTARGTFGDETGEIHYSDVKVTHEDQKIWNIVRITPASGNTQEARDEASIADHFERPLEKSWPLADDNEALAAAQYLVQRYSRMQTRITELSLLPRSDPDAMWPVVLGIEQGHRYRFRRRPDGDATGLDKQLVVEQIAHATDLDNHRTTLQLSLADPQMYWRLEVTGFGELDSTTRLAY